MSHSSAAPLTDQACPLAITLSQVEGLKLRKLRLYMPQSASLGKWSETSSMFCG